MKLASRTAAAALLISLPMALSACGSDGGSKPARADVQSGYTKLLKSTTAGASLSDATAKKISKCVVDKTYDKLSNRTLNAMKSGDENSKADSKDESTLKNATTTCATKAVSGS